MNDIEQHIMICTAQSLSQSKIGALKERHLTTTHWVSFCRAHYTTLLNPNNTLMT
jgi:hypothetical protein